MDIADAFAGEPSPETFFLERLPDLHEDRLELFGSYSETTLRFSIYMTDIDRRFCLELSPDGARAIEGEFIEFPTVTLEGTEENWPLVRDHARRLFEKGRRALNERPPASRVDREFTDDFERFDGVIDVELVFEERDEPVSMRLILNDYQPVPDARQIEVGLSVELLDEVLEGRIDPDEARESVTLSGDVGLAFDLSGLLMEHFPEIE
ncbi:MAG: hypothetical protein ABEN55_11480 [Bradymonadaceae bacterium]